MMKTEESRGNMGWGLAYFWFGSSAALLIALLVQTTTIGHGSLTLKSWTWFFPTILPCISVVFLNIQSASRSRVEFKRTKRLAWVMSTFYVLIVVITFVIVSVFRYHDISWYDYSYFWLMPLQALVLNTIGMFAMASQRVDGAER